MEIGSLLRLLAWIVGGVLLLLGVDRLLIAAEARGWIYHRRRRPVRGGSMYHLNELSQMLTGSNVPEIREEIQDDESGDPCE